ncbi:universal stress protein [Amycolatopsis benzoatilytica]|uniref:universal stress protein n=1 Tax=Amycolatopsis benzoatilytica TaxID=346045 RepID=UPI00037B8CFF|nr:universal stress protein [Amycolatopsis benzoatilytica]
MDEAETGVVVGDDGSDGARRAIDWAAAEAQARGTRLVVVRAVPAPMPNLDFVPGTVAPSAGEMLEGQAYVDYAEKELAGVAAVLREQHPSLAVRTHVRVGRASWELADAGKQADLIVVGASGRRGLPRLLLGSTAAQVVHTSARPVVVVRGAEPDARRVVVGVDGSAASIAAVRFAFDFADRHGCPLQAVHAWTDPVDDLLEPVGPGDEGWPTVRERGERLLAESLTGLAERYPDVVVQREIGLGRAAVVLLEHAEGAALLVVGGHGRGALSGAFLGSVSHAMAYHAPCPVAIVREDVQEYPS